MKVHQFPPRARCPENDRLSDTLVRPAGQYERQSGCSFGIGKPLEGLPTDRGIATDLLTSGYSAAIRWARACSASALSSTGTMGAKSRWAIHSGRVNFVMWFETAHSVR
jgi:hypothetical protein